MAKTAKRVCTICNRGLAWGETSWPYCTSCKGDDVSGDDTPDDTCTVIYSESESEPNMLRRGWWWSLPDRSCWYGPFVHECDAEAAAEAYRIGAESDPDEEPFPPYTYGARLRNPYYTAQRDIWRYKDGEPVELMISKQADVTDILQAYDVDYQLAEVIAKILRLGRKEGTNRRQEYTKMHEHIQAAEDAWVAEEKE